MREFGFSRQIRRVNAKIRSFNDIIWIIFMLGIQNFLECGLILESIFNFVPSSKNVRNLFFTQFFKKDRIEKTFRDQEATLLFTL